MTSDWYLYHDGGGFLLTALARDSCLEWAPREVVVVVVAGVMASRSDIGDVGSVEVHNAIKLNRSSLYGKRTCEW